MECLSIDDAVGQKAGEYMKVFKASHGLEMVDALIAASAFRNDVPLWSFNKKHYPMKDIELFH
jgi:predicted nucleic acid-binding protein